MKTFVAAVECGSFSAAARKLGKAQSAISTTISNLEIDLDVILFDRSAYRPVPTEQAKALLKHARTVLESEAAFRAQAEAFSGSVEPSFALIVEEGLLVERVCKLFVDLSETFSGLELTIEQTSKKAALKALKTGEAGAAFVVQAEASDPHYHCRGIGFQRCVPVCNSTHPLANQASLSRMDLTHHRQIVGPNDRHFSPNIWISANSAARKTLVLNGMGWAELPVDTVQSEVLGGELAVLNYEFAQNSILYPVDFLTSNASVEGLVMRWMVEQISAWDQRAWIGDRRVGAR
nr:LysR family transcriptional regulator [Ruegeria sp. Ofav3-42]